MAAPIAWRIRTLTPWLKAQGARRGDIIIDRMTEQCRYAIVRELPAAGFTTGQILIALGEDRLEPIRELGEQPSRPCHLRLVSGDPPR